MSDPAEETMVQIVAKMVPINIIEAIIQFDDSIPDFNLLIRRASTDPEERRLFAAQLVVRTYSARREIEHFAKLLARKMRQDDELIVRLTPFLSAPQTTPVGAAIPQSQNGDAAKQAKLAVRAHFIQSRKLREFLTQIEPQICLIISTIRSRGGYAYKLGTGFLVGPDLVLTAYHNIKEHAQIADPTQIDTDNLTACFDFLEGQKLQYPDKPAATALHIGFHTGWLVSSSPDLESDGLLTASEEQNRAVEIGQSLDFALLRLVEPIGEQTCSYVGGERRGWVDLTSWNQSLQDQERIIIPQHPEGDPQQIDFGRFSKTHSQTDVSQTRLRYDTETAPGTSGAPCFTIFDSRFHAVGVHNATFKPNGMNSEANQAIDLKKILPRILPHLPATGPPPATRIWNVGSREHPRVILGRTGFLDWLDRARSEDLVNRNQRLYAARSSMRRSGRSYSIDILRASLQNRTDPIVELGTTREAMPTTVPDFLKVVLYQLGLSTKLLDKLPPRPDSNLPGFGDRLHSWASEAVPIVFNEILANARMGSIDRRSLASAAVKAWELRAMEPPDEVRAIANSEVELKDTIRWSPIWIVLDNLDEIAFSEDLEDLIAGLTGAGVAETGVPPELRRLRWIFLGGAALPRFADRDDVTVEELDPMTIGAPDMINALVEYFSSLQLPVDQSTREFFSVMADMLLKREAQLVSKPATRLRTLQSLFEELREDAFRTLGKARNRRIIG